MTEPIQIDGDKLYAKLAWRIIPFMFILYIAAFLNRANIAYAKLTFTIDLNISEVAYGIGYGVFFIGYLLFEVPSNLIMEKVGARIWIARIMLTWGVISASFMFMWNEWSFYTLRFLLGIAEAGFFPGMILYLSYWFPVRLRARMVARFMVAIPISYVIGAPVSGLIIDHIHADDLVIVRVALREPLSLADRDHHLLKLQCIGHVAVVDTFEADQDAIRC